MSFFNIFKNNQKETDFSPLAVDMHSHLIPGIDDGADTVETSLDLIRGLRALGFRRLITTPHVMADLYPNSRDAILEGLEKVRAALAAEQINVSLDAAAEYMLDEQFRDILESDQILTLPGNHVLIELGFIAPPPGLHSLIFRLQTKGFHPIIAHPERYGYFRGDLTQYQPLRDYGCAFQVNTLSLTGHYGSTVQRTAEKLIKAGWVDFLGTDLHHAGHLTELQEACRDGHFAKIMEQNLFRNAELQLANSE